MARAPRALLYCVVFMKSVKCVVSLFRKTQNGLGIRLQRVKADFSTLDVSLFGPLINDLNNKIGDGLHTILRNVVLNTKL